MVSCDNFNFLFGSRYIQLSCEIYFVVYEIFEVVAWKLDQVFNFGNTLVPKRHF